MAFIHGHTIMHWLSEAPEPLRFEELEQRVTEQFGAQARFKTCNSEGHTLTELLAVLLERGKIDCIEGSYRANTHQMCSHD